MPGTVALEQHSTCTRPAAKSSLPQGLADLLKLRRFDYVAQDQHTCRKPSVFFSVTASQD